MSTQVDWIKEIGQFKPQRFQYALAVQWAEFIRTHVPEGFYLYGHPEFRHPDQRVDPDVQEWHHDLNIQVRDKTYLIVWADRCTTEIKHVDGTERGGIIRPAPFMAVMFRNDRWQHRQPKMAGRQFKKRKFARAWVTRDHDLALNYFGEQS